MAGYGDIATAHSRAGKATTRPLILNLFEDVIPSVAEESKNLEMDSRTGISDSSAVLGMT